MRTHELYKFMQYSQNIARKLYPLTEKLLANENKEVVNYNLSATLLGVLCLSFDKGKKFKNPEDYFFAITSYEQEAKEKKFFSPPIFEDFERENNTTKIPILSGEKRFQILEFIRKNLHCAF